MGLVPGVGNSKLLQYFCTENPIDRGGLAVYIYSLWGHKESDMTQSDYHSLLFHLETKQQQHHIHTNKHSMSTNNCEEFIKMLQQL